MRPTSFERVHGRPDRNPRLSPFRQSLCPPAFLYRGRCGYPRGFLLLLGSLLFLELLWRMTFEYLVAFLRIREALLTLTTPVSVP